MMSQHNREQGAALLTALVVLLVMAVIGIQLATQSNINKDLVRNESARAKTEQYAQNVANIVLSDINHFLDPVNELQPYIDSDARWGTTPQDENYVVSVTNPVCIRAESVEGYSLSAQIAPEVNYWEFSVTVSDPLTGASTTLEVGAKFNYTTGNC